MKKKTFFIVGAGRSGTTSLARILDMANNASCAIEPNPNLNSESRDLAKGFIEDPSAIVREIIIPRCEQAEEGQIYGEKQVTLGGFIPYIAELTDAKFVYVYRDGRDVVRSWVDWHNQIFGTTYRECRQIENISPEAISSASNLPLEHDTSDYAKPRPEPGEKWFWQWSDFSREQMCAYYWSVVNNAHLKSLSALGKDRWIGIDYSNVTAAKVLAIAKFLGLEGLSAETVAKHLDLRINSINERNGGESLQKGWQSWTSRERMEFWEIAGETMITLGYAKNDRTRWKPEGFGSVWEEPRDLFDWYKWMYDYRTSVHDEFLAFYRKINADSTTGVKAVADFGSGIGYGYSDAFSDIEYHGYDIADQVVKFANELNKKELHQYFCLDYICQDIDKRYDLVFSSGTIDNSYDVDMYLAAMVRCSRDWIYFTCYRGWFSERQCHKYSYNRDQHCFYNDLSISEIEATLHRLECYDITISKVKTNQDFIPYETVVSARVKKCS